MALCYLSTSAWGIDGMEYLVFSREVENGVKVLVPCPLALCRCMTDFGDLMFLSMNEYDLVNIREAITH